MIQAEPDSRMMIHVPMNQGDDYDSSTLRYMKMGQVYDQQRRLDFERRVKAWLRGYITGHHPGETVVISVAPGHQANDNTSFMYRLVNEFIAQNIDLPLVDGRGVLVRWQTIPKQSAPGSIRNEDTHRNSIIIQGVDISGKVVIILDDVWTTGCTLRVCKEKILEAGAKVVKMLAIGRTIAGQ